MYYRIRNIGFFSKQKTCKYIYIYTPYAHLQNWQGSDKCNVNLKVNPRQIANYTVKMCISIVFPNKRFIIIYNQSFDSNTSVTMHSQDVHSTAYWFSFIASWFRLLHWSLPEVMIPIASMSRLETKILHWKPHCWMCHLPEAESC